MESNTEGRDFSDPQKLAGILQELAEEYGQAADRHVRAKHNVESFESNVRVAMHHGLMEQSNPTKYGQLLHANLHGEVEADDPEHSGKPRYAVLKLREAEAKIRLENARIAWETNKLILDCLTRG